MEQGTRKVVLNLAEVQYVDSSGIGELVRTHTTVRNQGGPLRLSNLNKRIMRIAVLSLGGFHRSRARSQNGACLTFAPCFASAEDG